RARADLGRDPALQPARRAAGRAGLLRRAFRRTGRRPEGNEPGRHGRQPQHDAAFRRVHLPAGIRGAAHAAARLPGHAVRREHLSVQAGVPRLLLHQRVAGRQRARPVEPARGQPFRPGAAGEKGGRGCRGAGRFAGGGAIRLFLARAVPQGGLRRPRTGQA
ncbi:hypothetical protein LTR94_032907, partial [Friedmanniomyces endolithicus]